MSCNKYFVLLSHIQDDPEYLQTSTLKTYWKATPGKKSGAVSASETVTKTPSYTYAFELKITANISFKMTIFLNKHIYEDRARLHQ